MEDSDLSSDDEIQFSESDDDISDSDSDDEIHSGSDSDLNEAFDDDDDLDEFNPLDFIRFGRKCTTDIAPRFGLTGSSYYFEFKNVGKIPDAEQVARAGFDKVLEDVYDDAAESDLIGVSIDHPALDHEILIRFGDQSETTTDAIMDVISSVQQSKKELDFDTGMCVKITRITPPQGEGYKKMADGRFGEGFKKHSGGNGSTFIEIKNKDSLCFARAVVVAKARYEFYELNDQSVRWESIRKGDKSKHVVQKNMAFDLMVRAGMAGFNQACGHPEFEKIQRAINREGFQLKIFSHDHFDSIIFDQELVGYHTLYIYHHGNHFSVMSSPRVLTGTNHWCDFCNRGYNREHNHKCPYICPCCRSADLCQQTVLRVCPDCSRLFKSDQCIQNHLKRPERVQRCKNGKRSKVLGDSVCMKLKRCKECGRCVMKSELPPNKHHCGETYCGVCRDWYTVGAVHQCFMQPIKARKTTDNSEKSTDELRIESDDIGDTPETARRYLFFDFETIQQDVLRERDISLDGIKYSLGPMFLHKPNYCIARKVCMICKDFWLGSCSSEHKCVGRTCEECQEEKPDCSLCNEHYARFTGEDCRDQFCDFLFREEHKNLTALAHNSRGFDAHFIIQWLLANKRIPKIIPRGLKILSLECMKIRIIDSYSFLPQSLSSLPKTFSETEIAKGYFPYLFSRRENENYIGVYPEADMYCPAQMKDSQRGKFYEWYSKNKNGVFDYQKELQKYTESDVDILLRCVMKFNDQFHEITGVYPLEVSITIAQACNHVFRKNFLKKNTIGVIPPHGYRGAERQSLQAIEWLQWVSHTKGVRIQHARNGLEKKVGKYKLDGWFENTALEFNGCAYHGCMKCYKNRDGKVPNSNLTYEEAYRNTIEKENYIKSQGYHLITIWECEWRFEKQRNREIRDFLNSIDSCQVLDARNALAGGRTNATTLYRKAPPGGRIDYLDVCSLYPFCCKTKRYPIGHPTVLLQNFKEITPGARPYFGLIRCTVLPPRGLLHPVLPYKANNRLNFPLCRTCVEEQNQNRCDHCDTDRSFTSDFVSEELYKAVELGYRVTKTWEVWHYPEQMEFDGDDPESGLFTEYINAFYKLKSEATGYPSWVKTEADKTRFIVEFEQREGIRLDPEKVEKNSGFRAIAKLILNSFWGKFAQKANDSEVEFCMEPIKFFDIVFNRENLVSGVRGFGPEMVAVNYRKTDDHIKASPNTSVVLACFVTCWARLELYKYIEKLQDRICYFDTDSIIFSSTSHDTYFPPVGDFLGDLTDELQEFASGAFISEFVSCGPKQYSFRVKDGSGKVVKTVTKSKGFSLDYTAGAHINFKRMKRQVFAYVREKKIEEVTVYHPQIRRLNNHQIVTTTERKVQKLVYVKRVVQNDFTSLPYGY